MSDNNTVPSFLEKLLTARSPSGYEGEVHGVLAECVEPFCDEYVGDTMGNRLATVQGEAAGPVLMLAGHMDELGLQVKYVDDKGFLFFNTLGGHDTTVISGRRVEILTKNGVVPGVTGKRAVHLLTPEERKKAPRVHEIWIDIGAASADEALQRVAIGDPIVYDHGLTPVHGSVWASRAFDDKTGCYVVNEALIRLFAKKQELAATVVAVSTAQEEVGTRGAVITAEAVKPALAIAVDVAHATDHPDCDPRKHGKTTLGGGPILYRGPNINPFMFERLVAVAQEHEIAYQVVAGSTPLGNDSRAIQIANQGVATGCIGIPLRYMHTPSELIDLGDLEYCVQLIEAFALSLSEGDDGVW